MTGLNFSITIDDRDVRQALNSLLERGDSLRPPFEQIGEYLIDVHEARFEKQIGPDGKPWQPLSDKYRARKERHQDMILVLNKYLAQSFFYQASDDEVELDTQIKYAALHQFGFTGPQQVAAHSRRTKSGKTAQVSAHTRQVNIPARPFMGVTDDDKEEIIKIITDYLVPRE